MTKTILSKKREIIRQDGLIAMMKAWYPRREAKMEEVEAIEVEAGAIRVDSSRHQSKK